MASRKELTEGANVRGWIFDITRFAVHDGPGVRTTVFLKGCSLRCCWCHNPESISPKPELMVLSGRCISCRACIKACPSGAHKETVNGEKVLDRGLCTLCGRCVDSCYPGALAIAGRRVSVEDVMSVVRQDMKFYEVSGGGVTLSGGEPLLQTDFATGILKQCKAEGIHTCIETCGQVKWRAIEKAVPYLDLALYDLKHISPEQHRKYTGRSNRLILDNLRRLSDQGLPIEIRMLIVPTINDSGEAIDEAARFVASLRNIVGVRLLAYHRLAGSKYVSLGRNSTMPDVAMPSRSRLLQIASRIRRHGLRAIAPSAKYS